MTQEELDAMMNGEIDDIDGLEFEEEASNEPLEPDEPDSSEVVDTPEGYNDKTSHHWPPPATDENKMVHHQM